MLHLRLSSPLTWPFCTYLGSDHGHGQVSFVAMGSGAAQTSLSTEMCPGHVTGPAVTKPLEQANTKTQRRNLMEVYRMVEAFWALFLIPHLLLGIAMLFFFFLFFFIYLSGISLKNLIALHVAGHSCPSHLQAHELSQA